MKIISFWIFKFFDSIPTRFSQRCQSCYGHGDNGTFALDFIWFKRCIVVVKQLYSNYTVRLHCWQAIATIAIDVTVPWSVSLSVTFVLKRQKISTWFLLLTTAPRLSWSLQQFRINLSTPSSPNCDQKWPTQLIWASGTFDGKVVSDSAMVTTESL